MSKSQSSATTTLLMRDVVFMRSRGRWMASPRRMIGAYGCGRTRAGARAALKSILPVAVEIASTDARWPKLYADVLSAREHAAVLQWLETGKARPPSVLVKRAKESP